MIRSAPTIETERLVLRAWTKADFRAYYAIVSDDAVMRFVGGKGLSEEDGWRRLAAAVGMWDLLGFGGWSVVRKSDETIVGMVSLFNAWRELEPQFGEEPEMGWIFSTDTHGQGLAFEACRAALDWAESHLEPTPIWAIVAPANAPSLKLAQKLGFETLRESPYHGEPTLVLRRPAWTD